MKSKEKLVPVKKILSMINSCQSEGQIDRCKPIIENYIKSARKNKLENITNLQNRLNEEMLQRQEALYLVKIFNV